MADETIDRCAQGGVGREPRISIRSAALQCKYQFGRGNHDSSFLIGPREHFLENLDAGFHCLLGAAGVLDRHGAKAVILDDPVLLFHSADLEHLASKAYKHHTRNVWIRRIPPLGTL